MAVMESPPRPLGLLPGTPCVVSTDSLTEEAMMSIFTPIEMGQPNLIEVLQREFRLMDTQNTGKLSEGQVEPLLRSSLPEIADRQVSEVKDIFRYLDEDGDGVIDFAQLIAFMAPPAHDSVDEWDVLHQVAEEGGYQLEVPRHWREWLWAVLNVDEAQRYLTDDDWLRKLAVVVQTVSQLAICASILNMMVESEPGITVTADEQGNSAPTFIVEAATIAIFTIEFVMRLISCPSPKRFWSDSYTWVDLLAVLPFYLTEIGLIPDGVKGLAALRVVRLTRLLRILKVGRHSVGIHLMTLSVRNALMPLLWLWFVLILAMILFSALVFQAETAMHATLDTEREVWVRDADAPYTDAGKDLAIQSIHSAMWWSITTLTTTGYGDMVPRTEIGKAVGALTMMCGILLLAFPTTILTQQFAKVFEEYEHRRTMEDRKARLRKKLLEQLRERERGQKRTAAPRPVQKPDGECENPLSVRAKKSRVALPTSSYTNKDSDKDKASDKTQAQSSPSNKGSLLSFNGAYREGSRKGNTSPCHSDRSSGSFRQQLQGATWSSMSPTQTGTHSHRDLLALQSELREVKLGVGGSSARETSAIQSKLQEFQLLLEESDIRYRTLRSDLNATMTNVSKVMDSLHRLESLVRTLRKLSSTVSISASSDQLVHTTDHLQKSRTDASLL
eukprot:Sspe_Gene.98994::Locus_72406_Transcript_1_1_Confidence_1.000_Length_2393::g.98994::m.98994